MAFGEAGDVRLLALKTDESYQCSSSTAWILAVVLWLLLENLTLSSITSLPYAQLSSSLPSHEVRYGNYKIAMPFSRQQSAFSL